MVRSSPTPFRFIGPVVAGVVLLSAVACGPRPAEPEQSTPSPTPTTSPAPTVVPARAPCDAAQLTPDPVDGFVASLDAAEEVVTDDGHPVCRVRGVIAPQIRFVLEFPTQTYRQRYLQIGCGGLCGKVESEIPQAEGCVPLTNGEFVTATNDLGHQGADGRFGLDPQLRADFAYRADHALAVVAKAMIRRMYGEPPLWSYFGGCSQGGHEGLTEAQRYPDDFDGIVAGAPAHITTALYSFFQAWLAAVSVDSAGAALLDAGRIAVLHRAVLASCDEVDGLADGQLDDPRACGFDPRSVQCAAEADPATCLTQVQVEVARRLYSGPVTADGRRLYPGGQPLGSELDWTGWIFPEAPGALTGAQSLAGPWLQYLADVAPAGRPEAPVFSRAAFQRVQELAGLYDATDPDLSAFRDSGGKLLLYHGWGDPAIPPAGTLAYYRAVQDRMGGAAATTDFARLYMVPGLAHCTGGQAPKIFDTLTPMLRWVEQGVAPEGIVVTDVGTGRTRPVFPYPQASRHDGTGSVDDAASFDASDPDRRPDDEVSWLGSFEVDGELWWDGDRLTGRRPPDR